MCCLDESDNVNCTKASWVTLDNQHFCGMSNLSCFVQSLTLLLSHQKGLERIFQHLP